MKYKPYNTLQITNNVTLLQICWGVPKFAFWPTGHMCDFFFFK